MANRRSPKQKPPLGAVPNFAHPLSQGLVGWWLFNEQGGIKANDISGRGNNGTLTGGPTWNNQALSFDGVNDYVDAGNGSSLTLTDLTVSFWFKPTVEFNSSTGRKDLLAKFLSYWVILNYPSNDGKITLAVNAGNSVTSTQTSWTAGQWYHFVGTISGTTGTIYIDGIQSATGSLGSAPSVQSYTLQFGGNTTAGTYGNLAMDDVRIYNRALSAQEVRTLYETPYVNIARVARRSIAISGDTAAVTGTITTATQTDIVAGGKTLVLTLTGDTWVASGATFDAQRQAIINGVTSAQSEAFGWNAVPKTQQSVTGVVRTSDTVVTVTWDAFATYDISSAETITVTVPSSALTGGVSLVATPTFSITPVFARRAFVLDNGTRLTSGRIPYSAGSNGLADSSGLTYSTTTGITAPGFISNGLVRLKGYTVGTLPSGTQGDTAFVTDANATTFNSTVAGGGSNIVCVFYNGTNWVIQ